MSTLSATLNINPALWLLLKMNLRGAMRKLIRNVRTPHGAIVSIIVGGYLYFAITQRDAIMANFLEMLRHHGAIGVFLLFLLAVGNGLSGRGIFFTNAEVQDFLD